MPRGIGKRRRREERQQTSPCRSTIPVLVMIQPKVEVRLNELAGRTPRRLSTPE